jgi:hypothetical protein
MQDSLLTCPLRLWPGRTFTDWTGAKGFTGYPQFGRFQSVWMATPQEALGGRVPLAVILEEKGTRTEHAAYWEIYRSRKLMEMYAGAREMLDDGRPWLTRKTLEAILQIDPGHPFARRLLKRLA